MKPIRFLLVLTLASSATVHARPAIKEFPRAADYMVAPVYVPAEPIMVCQYPHGCRVVARPHLVPVYAPYEAVPQQPVVRVLVATAGRRQ